MNVHRIGVPLVALGTVLLLGGCTSPLAGPASGHGGGRTQSLYFSITPTPAQRPLGTSGQVAGAGGSWSGHGLSPSRLMSSTPVTYRLSTGAQIVLPGEFVYPEGVTAAVSPPFALSGRLEY